MNISWKWLLDYVDYPGPRDEAVRLLTMSGSNVDSLEERPGGDALMDVEITSNRPDCLGHLGVARELAALTDSPLKVPDVAVAEGGAKAADLTAIEVADPAGCPRYTARVIRGVKVGPSPRWLTERLEAVGLRPVNNVVDVTNFVLYEHGQPLHAFDYNKLAEHRIVVRRAKAGERFVAIDHSEHNLNERDLVIADARRAVALAGVMGGADTEVTTATTDILLESALFTQLGVRTTSRGHQLMSDASYRFERGVDYSGVDWASRRACQLILQVAGGQLAEGVVDVSQPPPAERRITLRLGQLKRVLGIEVPRGEVLRILQALGSKVISETGETAVLIPPPFRRDLDREIDLVEEVARVYGFDKVPYLKAIPTVEPVKNPRETVMATVQQTLIACGYQEAVTLTLVDAETAALLAAPSDNSPPVTTRETAATGVSYVRKSVAAGLLQVRRVNQDAGVGEVSFFEIARGFSDAGPEAMPKETVRLALLTDDDPELAKGTLEVLAARLGLGSRLALEPTDQLAEFDQVWQAEVRLDGRMIGFCGLVGKEIMNRFKFRHQPWVAEIELDPLVAAAVLGRRFQPLAQFPAIERDLALVVDDTVLWRDLKQAIAAVGVAELEEVNFVSVYQGQQIPAGKKCLAVRLRFRAKEATLTHEAADRFQDLILKEIREKMGAVLR